MASGDIRYSTLPRQEAPDPTRMPTPPPSPFAPRSRSRSRSSSLSPSITLAEDFGFLSLSPSTSTSTYDPSTSPRSTECSISTIELFPGLRRERLSRCGFTDEQNGSIENLLAVADDVQRRLRTAYAKERETGGYFQPDAHRQIIREHKIGDWMVVRLGYWEALVAIRGVLGDGGRGGDENEHGNDHSHGDRDAHGDEMSNNDNEDDTEDEDGDANMDMEREREMAKEREKEREMEKEKEKDRDKRYDRVVATLKDFIKILTTLKDKALKDKMQVNKQRYTHTGQWLNFLTIGAGVLIYIKNIFLAAPAAIVGVVGASSNATMFGGEI
jgi:hypothetical protein